MDGKIVSIKETKEKEHTSIEIEKRWACVRRHRFRCPPEEPTCIGVTKLGNQFKDCQNTLDRWWFGDSLEFSLMNRNDRWKDECSLLHEYIDQHRCATEQCFEQRSVDDYEWGCADVSDEHRVLKFNHSMDTIEEASRHDFTHRSYFVPNSCNESHSFLWLSPEATHWSHRLCWSD